MPMAHLLKDVCFTKFIVYGLTMVFVSLKHTRPTIAYHCQVKYHNELRFLKGRQKKELESKNILGHRLFASVLMLK